eukprot:CAMPEP_0197026994 /NCGR_PEP_ID=MMETSP1384-20130603/6991_1 /TAXON_ID=29189 /ORGANISM="Ammonia sp." /LENGTH=423 /DNA_ID=CAMNT_0042455781 /DNA_START=27 /DNA_END=1298 /DNA_ORIENTATION=-
MFATVSAYIVLSLITVTAIVLFFIIIQLIGAVQRHKNDPLMPRKPKSQKVLLLSLTIIGIVLFECAIVLVAVLLLELILVDHKVLHKPIRAELEYLILILDATAHITIIYAFSVRFVYCFSGTLSPYNKRLIFVLRAILLFLVLFTFAVLCVMVLQPSSIVFIFVLEMGGELVLHGICLCLFYLFVAHSYRLITMSFPKSNQFRDFIRHLSTSYQQKKEAEAVSRSSTSPSMSPDHSNDQKYAITIDGVPASVIKGVKPRKADETELDQKSGRWAVPGHSDPHDLVHVMNRKMLLATLVIISTICNGVMVVLTMIKADGRLADAQTIWVFFMLVFDMLVTTLMLYFQFTFNHELYYKVCHRLDLALMQVVLNLIKCLWRREHRHAHDMMRQETEMDNYDDDGDEIKGGGVSVDRKGTAVEEVP